MCVFFLLSSQLRSSSVSVVFDFNDSLKNAAPMYLRKFPVGTEKEFIVDGCLFCVFFLLPSPLRLSSVSVVFDFSESLNDVTPMSPMPFPVDRKSKDRGICCWMSFVCLLSFVFTTQTEFSECCV